MLRFSLHTLETAPHGSQELLRRVQNGFGFLPTLFAKLAESANALAAYLDLRAHFERSSLSPIEQQVVALATSVENGSAFCASAHSFAARNVAGLPQEDIDALRDGGDLPDPKLNVLADFTREVVRQRGRVNDGDLNVFLAAGYTMEQMLDVVMGVALKTFTNYASHIVRPSLNSQFAGDYWTPRPANEPLRLDQEEPREDEHDITARGRARH